MLWAHLTEWGFYNLNEYIVIQSIDFGHIVTTDGKNLSSLSKEQPVLLVFLRPFGCIFCMEAMKDLASQRARIESEGTLICCVHMSNPEVAESYFEEYGLGGIQHISDPDCSNYATFGLLKGNFSQLYGLKVWLRSAELAIQDLRRVRMKQIGDGFQMPGVFLLHNAEVGEAYRHQRTSDRPDYRRIIATGTGQKVL